MDKTAVKIILTFADGETKARSFEVQEVPDERDMKPPRYLTDMRKAWDRPTDPITYSAKVAEGYEKPATDWLFAL